MTMKNNDNSTSIPSQSNSSSASPDAAASSSPDTLASKPTRSLATQEQEFIHFLHNFSDLLTYMGVVESTAWRVLFEGVVFMSKKYAFTYHMTKVYLSLENFTKRFFAENSDTFKHKRVIGHS